MAEKKLIWHECRAAGLVFKSVDEWLEWLKAHKNNVQEAIAEHYGFKFNVNDVCLNPHVPASWHDNDTNYYFEVRTARTQFGWIYGYSYSLGSGGGAGPACYPRRDEFGGFYETEKQATYEAVCFLLRQLNGKRGKRDKKSVMFFYYLQQAKDKYDVRQLELFPTE